jgi:heme oxygenase
VLEGSTNGGRFLARALRKSWNLDGEGLSYFDPYGEEQPQKWAAFRRDMDEASFEADQEEAIIEMAKATFLAIAEVSDEVAGQLQ